MTNYHIGYENENGIVSPALEQGSTFILNFTITNIFAQGDTVDSLIIRAQYRPTTITTESFFTFDECDITSVTPTLVTGVVRMSANITKNIEAGPGFWDCEIEDSTGFVVKPFGCGSKCLVLAQATR